MWGALVIGLAVVADSLQVLAATPADLSSDLAPILRRTGVPAISCAVWRGDELIAIGSAGVRKYGDRTPVTNNDTWHIGSCTKAMTATLIAIYVERGLLRFEDTLAAVLPKETVHARMRPVTIQQVLRQRGGFAAEVPRRIETIMWESSDQMAARSIAARAVLKEAPAYTPGSRFVYSNSGYLVLGFIIEQLGKDTWENIIKKELFQPLGMKSCGHGAPGNRRLLDQPWGHEKTRLGQPRAVAPDSANADNPVSDGPSGNVHCNFEDWGKFLKMHLKGGRGEQTPILTADTIRQMQTCPKGQDYGYGWEVYTKPWAGGEFVSHQGSNTLWLAEARVAPKLNLAYACATNYDPDSDEGSRAIEAANKYITEKFGSKYQV